MSLPPSSSSRYSILCVFNHPTKCTKASGGSLNWKEANSAAICDDLITHDVFVSLLLGAFNCVSARKAECREARTRDSKLNISLESWLLICRVERKKRGREQGDCRIQSQKYNMERVLCATFVVFPRFSLCHVGLLLRAFAFSPYSPVKRPSCVWGIKNQ